MLRERVDILAAAASGLAVTMLVVYLAVIRGQDGTPAVWAVVALVVGGAAAAYGAVVASPFRGPALVLAGVALTVVGLLALLTIGLPILAAGALCIVAAARQRPTPSP